MGTIFDGRLDVHYGYWWIAATDGEPGDLTEAFSGQVNGLLGAGVPGALWGRTGLHTGHVRLRIETVPFRTPTAEDWEDIVEVSFRPPRSATLGAFEQFHELTGWPSAGWLRARLHASGLDTATDADAVGPDDDPVDSYLLHLWEAEGPQPDEVVRCGTRAAARWHATTAGDAPTGPPDAGFRVGSDREFVHVQIAGRERPEATDRWDGNWLDAAVAVAAGAFAGTWRATLRSDELADFRDQLARLVDGAPGVARYRSMEEWLSLDVSLDHLGHVSVTGRAVDQPGAGNRLDFSLPDLDPSELDALIVQLDDVLIHHPVRDDDATPPATA